jgi:hypothetical protein
VIPLPSLYGLAGTCRGSRQDRPFHPRPLWLSAAISIGEGLDIGENVVSPVDFTYKPPFAFTGKIEKVTYDLR